ncbi:hypothetical protein HNQ56_004362 [Anaerotaenia torta]
MKVGNKADFITIQAFVNFGRNYIIFFTTRMLFSIIT